MFAPATLHGDTRRNGQKMRFSSVLKIFFIECSIPFLSLLFFSFFNIGSSILHQEVEIDDCLQEGDGICRLVYLVSRSLLNNVANLQNNN